MKRAQTGTRPSQTQPPCVSLPGWQNPPELRLTKSTIQQHTSELTARFTTPPGFNDPLTPSGGAFEYEIVAFLSGGATLFR